MPNESQEMTSLRAAVSARTEVDASVITLLQGLSARITAAAGDKAASIELAALVNSQASSMAAAVVEHTPVA